MSHAGSFRSQRQTTPSSSQGQQEGHQLVSVRPSRQDEFLERDDPPSSPRPRDSEQQWEHDDVASMDELSDVSQHEYSKAEQVFPGSTPPTTQETKVGAESTSDRQQAWHEHRQQDKDNEGQENANVNAGSGKVVYSKNLLYTTSSQFACGTLDPLCGCPVWGNKCRQQTERKYVLTDELREWMLNIRLTELIAIYKGGVKDRSPNGVGSMYSPSHLQNGGFFTGMWANGKQQGKVYATGHSCTS